LLDAIVQRNGIDKPVRNLVAVLIDHRRLPFLARIVEQLKKELDARLGFTEAQISSARDLGDAEKRTLETQIEKTTRKKVRASYGLDPSLLGGAVVRIGSTIYDGSVKGQLERIKEAISS
jgi:F-type H+-transporting ATPase subunit delta